MPYIHWMMPGQPATLLEVKSSNLASIRFRAGVALNELVDRGWKISMGEVIPETDVLVIGKIGSHRIQERGPDWIRQVGKAKASGVRIYLDYTDNHLGVVSSMSKFYFDVLPLVDYCICPSDEMRSLLRQVWSGPVEVIGDPIEIGIQVPNIVTQAQTTALWFGHSSNIVYLKEFLETKFIPAKEMKIIALTNEEGARWFIESKPQMSPNVHIDLSLWSVHNMLKFARVSDICVIPSDVSGARKSGVSANRLITAMALGLPIAADRLPAYVEYSDYFTDIRSPELHELIEDPQSFKSLILRAQTQIVPLFSSEKFGVKWANLLENGLKSKA